MMLPIETIEKMQELLKFAPKTGSDELDKMFAELTDHSDSLIGYPRYTKSIDAAFMLVEGLGRSLHMMHFGPNGHTEVEICKPDDYTTGIEGSGKAPALAICDAVIKSFKVDKKKKVVV